MATEPTGHTTRQYFSPHYCDDVTEHRLGDRLVIGSKKRWYVGMLYEGGGWSSMSSETFNNEQRALRWLHSDEPATPPHRVHPRLPAVSLGNKRRRRRRLRHRASDIEDTIPR